MLLLPLQVVLVGWVLLVGTSARTIVNMVVDMPATDPYRIQTIVDTADSSEVLRLLCMDNEKTWRDETVLTNCVKEIVPAILVLIPLNRTVFVTVSPGTLHSANGPNAWYEITFPLCDDSLETLHLLVSVTTDSLNLRRFLLSEILNSFCFMDSTDPLYEVITPDIEKDFNLHVYKGLNYLDNLELVIKDEEAFDNFKFFDIEELGISALGYDISHVIFRVWYDSNTIQGMVRALTSMQRENIDLFRYIDVLSVIDNSIGQPATYDIGNGAFHLKISPVQMRYLLDAWMLHAAFGTLELSKKHILEVGGGYGGMAVTLSVMFQIGQYSIVDLEPACRLQQKYVAAVNNRNAHVLSRQVHLKSIPSTSTLHAASDILVSFFAISELNRMVIDKYLDQYVAYAPRGYLQLNYDDGESDLPPDTAEELYSAMQLFRLVHALHPGAVMLPPPSYNVNHRIVWKPNPGPLFTEGVGAGEGSPQCSLECRRCVSDMLMKE